MIKPKLALRTLTKSELVEFALAVADRVAENATLFAAPTPPPAEIITKANLLSSKMVARASLAQQLQNMTVEIGDVADTLCAALTKLAGYVGERAQGDITIIGAAGMDHTEGGGPVGPMPKIEGLAATQGDENGSIDLQWTPGPRGVASYTVEISETMGGLEGFAFCASVTKSSTTVTGLTSGKRYWFRVRAVGSAGPGPASDAVTRTAP